MEIGQLIFHTVDNTEHGAITHTLDIGGKRVRMTIDVQHPTPRRQTIINPSTCPVAECGVVYDEDDLHGQIDHMESHHPEVAAMRQAESRRWDGWVSD